MKMRIAASLLVAVTVAALIEPPAEASTLSVPYVPQQYKLDGEGHIIGVNWCWAACSTMLLNYYGISSGISSVVQDGLSNASYDEGNILDGSGYLFLQRLLVWSPSVTIPVAGNNTYTSTNKLLLFYHYNGIRQILDDLSSKTIPGQVTGPLSDADINNQINNLKAPFVVNYRWYKTGTTEDLGGHVVVCNGYDTGNISILDPDDPPSTPGGESYIKATSIITDGGPGSLDASVIDPTVDHKWKYSLLTSKQLDVLFLVDSTGSMGSYIADVQSNLVAILNKLVTKYSVCRIAVADYKDEPPPAGPGDYGDYVYNVDQAFISGSTGQTAIANAVNSLSAGGGGDTPEAVFSALYNGLSGNGLADGTGVAWRSGSVKRIIILVGDAPGHDPEAWAGGHSFNDTIPLALGANPISINCINPGTAADTTAQFQLISARTAGAFNDGSAGVGDTVQSLVDEIDANARFPQGTTGDIYPTFSFNAQGASAMSSTPENLLIDLQRRSAKGGKWHHVKLVTLKDPTVTTYTSTFPLTTGSYQWRLGYRYPAGNTFLPATQKLEHDAASTTFDGTWTSFTRIANPPGSVTIVSPGYGAPSSVKVSYIFDAVPGATSYVLQIYQNGRPWHTFKVRPPANNPTASVLSKTVGGHKLKDTYYWRIQGLNIDQPKPLISGWSYSY